jgi:hypothetical protein
MIQVIKDDELLQVVVNAHVSVVNALRRTLITNINTVGILPKDCIIRTNTNTCFSNEVLVERLRSIPVHTTVLVPDVVLKIHVKNEEGLRVVTTDDFVLGQPWYPSQACVVDGTTYQLKHELVELREGEELDLSATFSIVSGAISGVYTAVSDCWFEGVKDDVLAEEAWRTQKSTDPKDKHDFDLLTAKRFVKENLFCFNLRTIGVFPNRTLMRMACDRIISDLRALEGVAHKSDCMADCVDVVLTNTDFTIGLLVEHVLFEKRSEHEITFVSFYKHHPDDQNGILRIACPNPDVWKSAVPVCVDTFETIARFFA